MCVCVNVCASFILHVFFFSLTLENVCFGERRFSKQIAGKREAFKLYERLCSVTQSGVKEEKRKGAISVTAQGPGS